MSFSYSMPISNDKFVQAICRALKRKGKENISMLLKDSKISIDELGTSYYVDNSGRWDAIGIQIKFYVNPNHLNILEETKTISQIKTICEEIIPGEVGYDVKDIIFQEDLSKNFEIDSKDLLEDLDNKILNCNKNIIKELLPSDLMIKGYAMSEVYTYLYVVENSLRIFIERVGKKHFGDSYFDEFKIPTALNNTINCRISDVKSKKWLTLRGDSKLFYLDFKDLATIINNNWDLFKSYFPSQDFILPKIKELTDYRNMIAHNSYVYLSDEDKDIIKSYYNIILKQIAQDEKNINF